MGYTEREIIKFFGGKPCRICGKFMEKNHFNRSMCSQQCRVINARMEEANRVGRLIESIKEWDTPDSMMAFRETLPNQWTRFVGERHKDFLNAVRDDEGLNIDDFEKAFFEGLCQDFSHKAYPEQYYLYVTEEVRS